MQNKSVTKSLQIVLARLFFFPLGVSFLVCVLIVILSKTSCYLIRSPSYLYANIPPRCLIASTMPCITSFILARLSLNSLSDLSIFSNRSRLSSNLLYSTDVVEIHYSKVMSACGLSCFIFAAYLTLAFVAFLWVQQKVNHSYILRF